MLVLTRKSGEKLRIGNKIIVTVLDNSSSQIKLGIDAPQDIPIYREEIYSRIKEKNRLSVLSESLNPHLLSRIFKGLK